MQCLTVVVAALAVALAAAAPHAPLRSAYDPVAFAEEFINLGAVNGDPSTQDCNRYAGLFQSSAILHSPGVPDAYGTAAIVQACQNDMALVNPLISFQTLNINVTSWNTEKRTAVSWVINGVRTRDQQNVAAPAISCLFQDPQGIIETAWSFYDDNLVTGKQAMRDDPFNASTIVAYYTNLGNLGNEHAVHNCSLWGELFEADGISQEPGVPPVSGYDDLVALCTRRSTRWSKFIPSVRQILPVMSWNTEKRVAIEWTITGIMNTGKTYVVPAITMLLMSSDFKIQQSWDFWDDLALPVPTY